MERIDTSTKVVDLHGTGKHGWGAGDAEALVEPTQCSPAVMNAFQEELARVVEGLDGTLVPGTYFQLLRGIMRRFAAIEDVFGSTSDIQQWTPLAYQVAAGLTQPVVQFGDFWKAGKRVSFSPDYLASFEEDVHTFAASKDTYVAVSFTAWALSFSAVANGDPAPSPPAGFFNVTKVVTSGAAVTASTSLYTTDNARSHHAANTFVGVVNFSALGAGPKIRTHSGTTADNDTHITFATTAASHAAVATLDLLTLPLSDGAGVVLLSLLGATPSGDLTKGYIAIAVHLAIRGGGTVTVVGSKFSETNTTTALAGVGDGLKVVASGTNVKTQIQQSGNANAIRLCLGQFRIPLTV